MYILNPKVIKRAPSLTHGLVGWWRMDEGTGLYAYDSSGLCNHGSMVNMDNTNWKSGADRRIGNALSFDGVNEYVDCDNAGYNLGTDDFSISVWAKLKKDGVNRAFIAKGDYAINEFLLYKFPSNLIGFRGDAGSISLTITADWNADEWIYLVVTRSGTTAKIYLNGEYNAQSTVAGADLTNAHKWIIGASADGTGRRMDGNIDDVRIYNRALSEDEIKCLARLGT